MASALVDHISKVAKSSNDPGTLCEYVCMCYYRQCCVFKNVIPLDSSFDILSMFATFSQKCIKQEI